MTGSFGDMGLAEGLSRIGNPTLESFDQYHYAHLLNPEQDIRLIELLPGHPQDRIKIRIHHVHLTEPLEERRDGPRPPSLVQLQATLPQGWDVCRNLEGRFLYWNTELDRVTWTHPNQELGTDCYTLRLDDRKLIPKYEAMSYAWGSDQKPQLIEVLSSSQSLQEYSSNGSAVERNCSTRLSVTESLFQGLKYLRNIEQSRMIWADAVCINQEDDAEKGHQVRRMRDIYRLAHRVVVWLGLEADDSKHALSALRYLGNQVESSEDGYKRFPSPDAKEKGWSHPLFQLPYGQGTWSSILRLLQRQWFGRLWVVQEIHLASKRPGAIMQCGRDIIQFSSFQRAVLCLVNKAFQQPTMANDILVVGNMVRPTNNIILQRLLIRVAVGRNCRDHRDKIYGLLALAPPRFAAKIKVDYKAAHSEAQVYKAAFLAHIQLTQRWELFSKSWTSDRDISDLPSWVPDWSAGHSTGSKVRNSFAAGTSRAHFVHRESSSNILLMRGVRCATVSSVAEPLPADLGNTDAIRHVRRWQPPDLDTAIYGPTGGSLRDAYAMTLINDQHDQLVERFPTVNTTVKNRYSSRSEWARQDWPDALFGQHAHDSWGSISDQDSVNRPVHAALQNCRGCTFFQTSEGYIGLGPGDTERGDQIAVFLGCSKPLILRPIGAHYRVVGESVVHGLQDTRAFLGPLPHPWEVRALIGAGGRREFRFFNSETAESTRDDPRLERLATWERIDREPDADDPEQYDFFQHKATGEVINYDPRLEPEAMEARSVQLEWFSLM